VLKVLRTGASPGTFYHMHDIKAKLEAIGCAWVHTLILRTT